MEEIDDKFPLFEMLKIHEFAWFPKIKTLTASYFLKNNNFFLIFEKKNWKFRQNLMILSKMQSYQDIFFFVKKNKNSQNRSQNSEIFIENQANSWSSETDNKQEPMWMFFRFFRFSKKYLYSKGFLNIFFKKNKKNTKKCVKLIKITEIQALWTCLERLIQARVNLDGFLEFLYVFIK